MEELTLKHTVAKNIRTLRRSRDLTAVELAEALGVSQSTVSDWETAKKMPRAGAVERLAAFFGVRKSDVLSDKSEALRATTTAHYELYDLEAMLEGSTRLAFDGRVLSVEEKQRVARVVKAVLS